MTTLIEFITESLGDNIAFSPYADEYQKIYGGNVYVKTKWYKILYSDNPHVYFIDKSFDIKYDKRLPIEFKFVNIPMQKIVCDQINVPYKELFPKIKQTEKYAVKKKKKYVCISIQSTSQMKYWNNSNGWNKVIKFLKKNGYDVYVIDKDEVFGVKEKWNKIPDGAINETGNYPIEYRIQQIKNCDFFIGLSSGLSWLAWALGKKVILISGCTHDFNEPMSNVYRVINKNVCHGCLNDESIDNKNGILGSWFYCPRNKDFECSKQILPDSVIEKINMITNTN
jgi:autotransporter strand-loop-strand O-heptosyltransferase